MPDLDPTGQGFYRRQRIGSTASNPLLVCIQATFSASGATVTVTTTGAGARMSHPGAAISGASGDYDVTGLPIGGVYHVLGCELLVADGTADVNRATVQADSLDPAAGTLTFQTRQGSDGAETAPADDDVLHLTLLLEPAFETFS